MQALYDLLIEHDITSELAQRLAQYGELLLEANQRCNLTAARTPEALLPHILDSLSFVDDVEGPLVDVGSGGGFPAIPIALATGVPVTMIESIAKKAKALRSISEALALKAMVLCGRAETFGLADEHREVYRCATARAVAVTPTVMELLMPFLQLGGQAIIQRGGLEEAERQASTDAALVLGGEWKEERLLEGQRRLLYIKKVRKTPWRFPRKNGAPAKFPLCM
jgi:16S rRNA (guanine527-N7)-methyltransferase